jgi:hypothetical protein
MLARPQAVSDMGYPWEIWAIWAIWAYNAKGILIISAVENPLLPRE